MSADRMAEETPGSGDPSADGGGAQAPRRAGEAAEPLAPPPRAEDLVALDADSWAELLPHIRAALHDLDERLVTRHVEMLRAAPPSRLAGGRLRRTLAELLAAGGPAWQGLVERLRSEGPEGLSWLFDGGRPPAAPPAGPPSRHAAPPPAAGDSDARRELERLRARVRELRAERDTARRQARGAEARAEALDEEVAGLRAALQRARDRIGDLEAALEAAAEEQERALDRERRRGESQLAELREEVRAYRRQEDERHREELRRQRAHEAAREPERARDEPRSSPTRSSPGRPTRLAPGVAPGTAEAAAELLEPGRLVLVDGYNVTRTHRGHLDLEQQRAWLVRLLEGLAARRRVRPQVFFDAQLGGGSPPAARQVQVRFTGAGLSADDEIDFAVAALPPDEPVMVVTDDRELAERVRRHDADVVGTRAFLTVAE